MHVNACVNGHGVPDIFNQGSRWKQVHLTFPVRLGLWEVEHRGTRLQRIGRSHLGNSVQE